MFRLKTIEIQFKTYRIMLQSLIKTKKRHLLSTDLTANLDATNLQLSSCAFLIAAKCSGVHPDLISCAFLMAQQHRGKGHYPFLAAECCGEHPNLSVMPF